MATPCTKAGRCASDGDRIEAAGPAANVDRRAGATIVDLPGTTLLPGSDRGAFARAAASVRRDELERSGAARVAWRAHGARRSTTCARRCMAGFTTIRDLGTEGAGYADVELKQAVEQGIIPGPRMLVVHARHRRDRQLRPEGLRAGVARAAGRRGGRRRRRSCASSAIRSGTAPTGSRSTPTTAGARAAKRRRRSRSRS